MAGGDEFEEECRAAHEPKRSPTSQRKNAELSRKIAFTFFCFARVDFFLLKDKTIFYKTVPLDCTAARRLLFIGSF